MRALVWLGQRGSTALAVMVLVGILTPPLGEVLRPFVGEAVFALLALAFLRTDLSAFGALARRPMAVLLATGWSILGIPLLALAVLRLGVADWLGPELALAILVQTVSLPLLSAPAIAALIGIDATLPLAGVLLASAVMPATAPLLLELGQSGLTLSALELAGRLAALLAGAAVLGFGLRRIIGRLWIDGNAHMLDGLNILALFVFIASVMGDVGPAFLAEPQRLLWLGLVGLLMNLGLLALTWFLFAGFGRHRAIASALLASQRNLGLMLAVMGTQLPETVWLYIAVSQIPIYFAAAILKPFARPEDPA